MEVSTELAIPESVVINPQSGEARELAELTADEILLGLQQMDQLGHAVHECKRKLAEEAMRRKNAGDAVPSVDVSRSNRWHVGETAAALDKLERDGLLPTDRTHYIQPIESHKAIGKNLNDLVNRLIEDGQTEAASVLLTGRRQSITAKVRV